MSFDPRTVPDASRRLLLRHAGALSLLTGAGAPLALNLLAAGRAAAQSAGDYRAVVCLFMSGGNDAYNTVLPTDTDSWQTYTSVRNQAPESIALLAPGMVPDPRAAAGSPARLGGVLPIQPARAQGRSFALHPLLASLRPLFDTDKRLAVLANVGPLQRPTSKAQYTQASHPKPANLFSHNDQQNTWQALAPEGATLGWGGRMADMLATSNAQTQFTAISAAGNAVWLSGREVRQYQVSGNGPIATGVEADGGIYGWREVGQALQRVVSSTRGTHVFEQHLAAVARRSIESEAVLRGALRPAADAAFGTATSGGPYSAVGDPLLMYDSPLDGVRKFNALAQQLQMVARLVDAGMRGASGVRRQVFFVGLGGFDTHDRQNSAHADLMARLAHALRYFDSTLGALGAHGNVTTFTASDFGRTFTSNGDGTDHGWGGHHFVMGGAVKGGDIYGRFPTFGSKNTRDNGFDSSGDQLANGALLPETSVEQMGATLARWFGLSDTQIGDVFPNLANFDVGRRNLGFMR